MNKENNQFKYPLLEQEALNFLLGVYLPSKFAEYEVKNKEVKFNLADYLTYRTISKVGFISRFRSNHFIDTNFLLSNKIAYLSGVNVKLDKEFFLDVIYFFKDGMLDSIELASYGETLPEKVSQMEFMIVP